MAKRANPVKIALFAGASVALSFRKCAENMSFGVVVEDLMLSLVAGSALVLAGLAAVALAQLAAKQRQMVPVRVRARRTHR
ncbi:hypothetical protein XFLAVUS301_23430 [Xanthobacter flavus]|uniref:Uncharacterized protein n=3 Tax=Xanthobacter TaxID=279 RepID=A0A9W6CKZ9_XANFL|nr:hypothetical protein XFLAVUS301_23430 [Xanthobacter flavus]